MTNRITRTQLEAAVNRLNRLTNNESEPYRKEGDKWVANIGNYHISGAYGGVALHRMCNEGGGVRDIFSCGHVTSRQLYDLIHAYIKGIEHAQDELTAA
jgi:hypothetical protein